MLNRSRLRLGAMTALLLALLLLLCTSAGAEVAEEITDRCTFEGCDADDVALMTDGDLDTYCLVKQKNSLTISCPEGISGVTLTLYSKVEVKKTRYYLPTVYLEVKNSQGEWESVGSWHDYLIEWLPVPEGTTEVRIRSTKKGSAFAIPDIHVYGPGEVPPEAPRWEELDKADLMIIVAHPDDELLWFGGMLPTYAGERGLRVQVVYATSKGGRKLELLQGLWTCGVKYYPVLFDLDDKKMKTKDEMYKVWREGYFTRLLYEAVRKYKPEVVATHDFNGEYGHMAHVLTAEKVALVVKTAGDASKSPSTAKKYGAWQVKKLYVHLWEENQIHLDWTKPLSAFGGETSISVATRALDCHVSQVKSERGWNMSRADDYDNGLFGLYYTTVGPDEAGDDIMEHIDLTE